jgi:hypothetical protein
MGRTAHGDLQTAAFDVALASSAVTQRGQTAATRIGRNAPETDDLSAGVASATAGPVLFCLLAADPTTGLAL